LFHIYLIDGYKKAGELNRPPAIFLAASCFCHSAATLAVGYATAWIVLHLVVDFHDCIIYG